MTGWDWGSIASLAISDVLLLRAFLRWDNRRLRNLTSGLPARERS